MRSPGSDSSGKEPLAGDLGLPVFTAPMQEHWPLEMTWAEAMRQIAPARQHYMKKFDSPEKRLRTKNPAIFRLP